MAVYAFLALVAGLLVSLSRQINGRLSLSTSPMESSFWNHIVGFGILSVIAVIFGGLFPTDKPLDPPPACLYQRAAWRCVCGAFKLACRQNRRGTNRHSDHRGPNDFGRCP